MEHILIKPLRLATRLPVGILLIVGINGLFLAANGLFMLAAPKIWYELVPGVTDTGFFNQHFVRDIGIVKLYVGIAFLAGLLQPRIRVVLWAGATLWLIGHACFHFWEVAVGICAPSALLRDFPAVSLPAIIGGLATAWAWQKRSQGLS